MSPRLVLVSLAIALGLAPGLARAADRPVVVELFTSQGCSSCPPANAFLNELARDRADVLALAFHIGNRCRCHHESAAGENMHFRR